jgi:hypothetical protein
MNEKPKEFLIDSLARANQIVFAALIVGPFVSGFSIWLFGPGLLLYAMLFILGMRISKTLRED